MKTRIEHDSMGEVHVPADKYWGAQTQRSYENFKISSERMPLPLLYAFAHLKAACAEVNHEKGLLSEEAYTCIQTACEEIIDGKLDEHFPLSIWQTGSGTQTNMNVNEVIANRGNELAGKKLLHPNDDVNKSQSSNDTFPSAMHLAALLAVQKVQEEIKHMCSVMSRLEKENRHIIKIGRTHLQDATPLRFSDEISGWRSMLENNLGMLDTAQAHLKKLAIGGTAVGTGLNAPRDFSQAVCTVLSRRLHTEIVPDENKFHALSSRDDICFAHSALKTLAANAMKIANDIRWLASGPRCGLGELHIPANEPGSSIMPGKVNPTQCEALTMLAVQVMGNDTAITIAASQGNFELNVYLPLIIYNFLQSADLLCDGLRSFRIHCVEGITANEEKMKEYLYDSLMLVTALNPYIGYENAAKTAKYAYEHHLSLKEACVQLHFLSAEEFDSYVDPERMVHPL